MKTYEEMAESVLNRIRIYEAEKKESRRAIRIGTAITAAAIVVIMTLFNISLPVYARGIPILGSVFAYIQDNLDFMGLYSSYAYEVGEKTRDRDVEITLSEVYCDGYNLFISYIVESDKFAAMLKKDEGYSSSQLNYYGKNSIIYDGKEKELDGFGITGIEGRFVDDRTFAGVETLSLGEERFPDAFTLRISVSSVGLIGIKQDMISGKWQFNIPVERNDEDVITYDINVTENGHTIDKAVVSPIMITIYTSYPDLYFGTVNYRVMTYSDISPLKDTSQMGEFAATSGYIKIPRDRVGKGMDIYVIDASKLKEGESTDDRDTVEKYAIVSAHINPQ